jgi:uroporphyrinogen-III synthase
LDDSCSRKARIRFCARSTPLPRQPLNNHAARRPANQSKKLSLKGERILITRAREQADKLSVALAELGAEPVEIPAIEIRPAKSYEALDLALQNIESYDWLILTSVNGVRVFFSRLEAVGLGPERLLHLDIAAIGPATAAAIEEHGLPVDVVPDEYVAESVVEALRSQVQGKRVLLVRAKVARDLIPQELRAAGATVHVMEAYETVVPESSRARLREVLSDAAQRPTAITFTSSSTARNFVELLGPENLSQLDGITIASIGPVTSQTLREVGITVTLEAHEYTIAGLVDALAEHAARR